MAKCSFTKTKLAALVLICIGLGCKKHNAPFEAKLLSAIDVKCQGRFPCTLRIKDVTDFEWDNLYVFKYTAHRGIVEKAVGHELPDFQEFHRKLIFTNRGNIVLYDEEPTNIEHVVNNEVVFDIPDSNDYSSYDANATFVIQKIAFSGGSYYQLTKVNR
ncbi:MAG TPA: hypothetical protein VF532_07595 [Candidatus Angelobacter sp.]